MKTNSVLILMALLILSVTSYSQSANDVKIGTIVKGKLSVTNENYLMDYFNSRLNNNGELGKIDIQYSPDMNMILVDYPVSGNSKGVSCIGITLKVIKNDVYFVNETRNMTDASGNGWAIGSLVSCKGNPCNSCSLLVLSWRPFLAQCKCNQANCNSCDCNMSITGHVNTSNMK